MQLLIDIGNTRLKWRWLRQGQLLPGGAESLPAEGSEPILFSKLWGHEAAPGRVLVSNVAGESIRRALSEWSIAALGRPAEFVVAGVEQGGVVNGYREPAALGVDRWCGLVGARTLVGSPLCVVSCGTAITMDLLDAEGRHAGGVIGPGLATMIQSLTGATRGIRIEAAPESFSAPLGRSTVECVRAGVLAAASGMVESTLERTAFPSTGVVFVTGGDAGLVASVLKRPVRIEHELVFMGLARIAGEAG